MIDGLASLTLHDIDNWLKDKFYHEVKICYFAVRHSQAPRSVWTHSFVIRLKLSVLCQIQKLNLEGQAICICGYSKCVTDYTGPYQL